MKPLIIDKRKKVNGLYTYCKKCQRLIENRMCSKTGKRISTCKNTEQHMFKAIITIPNTDGKKRKTRVFKTRDLAKATEMKIEFEQELLANQYQTSSLHISEEEVKPVFVIECMAMYIGYLNNEGVEAHKIKVRTQKHIKEVEYYFEKFCRCLLKNNIDHTLLKIDAINDKIVALFHNYLLNDLNYSNKTYNKIIALFRQFLNWLINEKKYEINNPFVGVTRRKVILNKAIITLDDFNQLIKVITPENNYETLKSGERKGRYKTWMANAFKLALQTGLRREEFMTLKFSDIKYDENNSPQLFEISDYKVERIKGVEEKKKYIPITKELEKLLIDLDYEQHKNTNRYIIGNNEKASRKTLIDLVSKSFTHFWKLTNIEKSIQLKNLRKTYLTSLVEQFGDKAPILSGHSGIEVLKKHYVNDVQLTKASREFSVFKNEPKK